MDEKQFVEIALELKFVTPEQIEKCLALQKQQAVPLQNVLLQQKLLDRLQLREIEAAYQNKKAKAELEFLSTKVQKSQKNQVAKKQVIGKNQEDISGSFWGENPLNKVKTEQQNAPTLCQDMPPKKQFEVQDSLWVPSSKSQEKTQQQTIIKKADPDPITNSLGISEGLELLELSPGSYLGKYQIISEIGRGGMGVVYKAQEKKLKRIVAIKTLFSGVNMESAYAKRFMQEAQLAAQLTHPNIVPVYDAGIEKNVQYLAMAYIEGVPLDEYWEENSLSVEEKLQLLEKVARGLEHAHEKGIVHRDIKPGNIIITKTKTPLIMDFGLAKSLELRDHHLTKTGEIMGTPHYIAPEQLVSKARKIDARADVYALGAILHEMLVGDYMVEGETAMEILYNVRHNKPASPRQKKPKISKDLEAIWFKSVTVKRDRYEHAGLLADDLQRFLARKPVLARGPGIRYKLSFYKKTVTVATAVIVLFVFYFANMYFKKPPIIKNSQKKLQFKEPQNAEEHYKRAIIMLKQKLYEGAIEHLGKAISKTKTSSYHIQQKLLIALTAIAKYKEALNCYQKLPQKLQKDPDVAISAAKAKFYLGKDPSADLDIVLKQKDPALLSQAHHYYGLICYHKKNYNKAIKHFQKVENPPQMLFFYLGRSYLMQNQVEKALKALLQVEKKVKNYIPVYEYLGRTYLEMAKTDQKQAIAAELNLRKCVKEHPSKSEYYTLLGESLQYQQKFTKANEIFSKALELDPANLDALAGVYNASLQDLTIQHDGLTLLTNSFYWVIVKAPDDLFLEDFKNILQRYRSDYVLWEELRRKNKGNPEIFLQKLSSGQLSQRSLEGAIEGLLSLRYHPQISVLFAKTLKAEQDKDKKKQIKDILERIEQKKNLEKRRAFYYRLAQIHIEQDLHTLQKLKKDGWQFIKEILKDTREVSLHRYLAAKALMHLLDYEFLENFPFENDVTGQIISTAVLRESRLAKEDNIFSKAVGHSSAFVRALAARTANTRDFLFSLLKDRDKRVQVYAADGVLGIPDISSKNPLWWNKAQSVFIEAMDHSLASIRSYAHGRFWRYVSIQKRFDEYRKYVDKGLKDSSPKVQASVLRYYEHLDFSSFTAQLIKIIKSSKDQHVHATALFALSFTSPDHPLIEKLLLNQNSPFLTRLQAFAGSTFFRMKYIKDIDFKILVKLGKKLSLLGRLIRDQNPYIKSSVSYLSALIGYYPLETFMEEKNNYVRSHMLANLSVKPINLPIMKRFLKFPKTNPSSLIKKTLHHKHDNLRLSSHLALVATSHFGKLKDIFNALRFSKDKYALRGAALGFYNLVYFHVLEKMPFLTRVASNLGVEEQYHVYTAWLLEKSQRDLRWQRRFVKWLGYAIELNDLPKYRYERAIIYKMMGKNEKALIDIEQAVKMAPNYPTYTIELARLLLLNNNKKNILSLLRPIISKTKHIHDLESLGEILIELEAGKFFLSKKVFQKLFLLNLKKGYINLGLPLIYAREGNLKKALLYLKYLEAIDAHKKLTQSVLRNFPAFTGLMNTHWVLSLPK